MTAPPCPILLYGPTASGKSALALALAERTGALIVNADALQVYADWRVLSARPTPDEEARAEHRLYGHVDAAEPGYSVGRWLEEASSLLDTAQAQGRAVIVIGGTGLYFTALTEGLAEIPPVPNETRAAVLARLERDGLDAAMAALRQRDPATAARVDPNNPRRVARALEVLEATGRGLADWAAATPPPRLPRSRATALVLDPAPDALARRIERRFHAMVEEGALAEVEAVRARGLDPALPAMRAHGAPALGRHLDGLCTLDEAIEAATTETRQYAKRQRTWARNRFADWERLRPEADFSIPQAALEELLARIAQR